MTKPHTVTTQLTKSTEEALKRIASAPKTSEQPLQSKPSCLPFSASS